MTKRHLDFRFNEKTMKILGLIVLLVLSFSFCFMKNPTSNGVVGVYSISKFEFLSELEIKPNGRFDYNYTVGGCQSAVTGDWRQDGKFIILNGDSEFENTAKELSPIYPQFQNFKWKIKARGLKPTEVLDTGCFKTEKIHLKIK